MKIHWEVEKHIDANFCEIILYDIEKKKNMQMIFRQIVANDARTVRTVKTLKFEKYFVKSITGRTIL